MRTRVFIRLRQQLSHYDRKETYATARMSAAHTMTYTSVKTVFGLRRKLNKRAGGMNDTTT